MTRVTNFGRKRTYLEANQDNAQMPTQMQETLTSNPSADPEARCASLATLEGFSDEPTSEPPKKRRKRGFSKKNSGQREVSESGML